MKHRHLPALLALPLTVAFSGCETAATTRYVDTQGPETVVSLDQINIQDWSYAADRLVNSLLSSGALERLRQPAILAVDRIVNNTTGQVDTDMLVKKIRVALMQTGKVQISNAEGFGEQATHANARRADDAAMAAFESGSSTIRSTQKMAQITVSGKLLENRARAGNTRQTTYFFQLSLNDIASGLTLWEAEEAITKQGRKASVGW